MPRELGIPFSAELIPPIMADLKTVTRRIVNPQPEPDGYGNGMWIWRGGKALLRADYGADYVHTDECALRRAIEKCARYQVGDRLWVKECWRLSIAGGFPIYRADPGAEERTRAIVETHGERLPWKSGRFMPKRYARTWLEVLNLRAEQLQSITEDDARREGVPLVDEVTGRISLDDRRGSYRLGFRGTWDKLHGRDGHGWDTNPWVVRYEFHRIQP